MVLFPVARFISSCLGALSLLSSQYSTSASSCFSVARTKFGPRPRFLGTLAGLNTTPAEPSGECLDGGYYHKEAIQPRQMVGKGSGARTRLHRYQTIEACLFRRWERFLHLMDRETSWKILNLRGYNNASHRRRVPMSISAAPKTCEQGYSPATPLHGSVSTFLGLNLPIPICLPPHSRRKTSPRLPAGAGPKATRLLEGLSMSPSNPRGWGSALTLRLVLCQSPSRRRPSINIS